MSNRTNRRIVGGMIILVGVLALLINADILSGVEDLLGGFLLLLGALFFFNLYNRDHSKWWPLLPGAILAVLGIGIIFDNYVPHASHLLGAAFMYTIFAVFAYIFTRDRKSWWAVLPAGVCFTLGTVALVDSLNMLGPRLHGVVFFLGIGLTFLYLWSLRHEIKNLEWAIWPAGVLLALALFVYANQARWLEEEYMFPLLVILVGVIIIVYGARKKK